MNENNTGWYEPLKAEERPSRRGKSPGKNRKGWKITGFILLAVLLLVGSSLLFSDKDRDQYGYYGDFGEEMPDDWREFFDSYYTYTVVDSEPVNIAKADIKTDFRLETQPKPGTELTLQELYKTCSPSIVAISGYAEGVAAYSWGTGVILSEDGLILTNTHLVEGCDSAVVTLCDDTKYEAKLIGADAISDIAVLKVEAEGLVPAQFGDSSVMEVGDRVAAIGNPLSEEFRMTLTDGIVSAIERGINYNGHTMALIQTNTAINGGNSGGALFNMHGQVVGITNMKMSSSYTPTIEGMGFAIPSANAVSYVNSIIEFGAVKGRTSIGVTVGAIPKSVHDKYADLPENGLYISAVVPGSDAEQKGIRESDILIAVNDIPVNITQDVVDIKDTLSVGNTIVLTVWRDGEVMDFEVVLADTNDLYN